MYYNAKFANLNVVRVVGAYLRSPLLATYLPMPND